MGWSSFSKILEGKRAKAESVKRKAKSLCLESIGVSFEKNSFGRRRLF